MLIDLSQIWKRILKTEKLLNFLMKATVIVQNVGSEKK